MRPVRPIAHWARQFAAFTLVVSLVGAASFSPGGAGAAGALSAPSTFFGIHAGYAPGNMTTPPWPVATYRLHDVGTEWCRLNPAPGQYDWTALDAWLTKATAQHAELVYVFSRPPRWATAYSDPTQPTCSADSDPAVAAAPDISAWQSFVAALVAHSAGRIKNYELWNEADWWAYWNGTPQQLAQLSDVAAGIIHKSALGARVLSPSITRDGVPWLQQYLTAARRGDIDVVSFHAYPMVSQGPEGVIGLVNNVRQAMAATRYGGYPLWATEGGWGYDGWYGAEFTAQFQRSYVARFLTLAMSLGVGRVYWYRLEPGWGGLVDATGAPAAGGVAMSNMVQWLSGAILTSPCQQATFWTCNFVLADGSSARMVWLASGSGIYAVPSKYRTALTFDGASRPVGRSIAVDTDPVLLHS